MIARVLPDLPAVEKTFDYLLPDAFREQVRVGTIVRIELNGRRVRGWVVEVAAEAADGVDPAKLKPVAKVSSQGPPPEVVDLASWAAWRWAGRWVHLLRTASSPVAVWTPAPPAAPEPGDVAEVEVLRMSPSADRWSVIEPAVAAGPAIIVVPEIDTAQRLARRLRAAGHRVVALAGEVRGVDYAAAASGATTVVGTRVALWAPIPDAALRSILVVDEHDQAMQAEQAPTWHARDVAVERARRAGVPCRLVSPVPSLDALALGRLVVAGGERSGWPPVEVVDRREEEPGRTALLSPHLTRHLRGQDPVVCVLNRLGRSRLLACAGCGQVADCEACGAAVAVDGDGDVVRCKACATERPAVCLACGRSRFKNLRAGVSRVREELEALIGEPVVEVTATEGDPAQARVSIGTEAVLHRLGAASVGVVAFLDLDQELLAPRFRAAEQALALLARGARAVGGRRGKGRLLLQTRLPDHPVVRAALAGDPTIVTDLEARRRAELRFPPAAALALVSGPVAPAWAAEAPDVLGVEVLDGGDGTWLVRADDPAALADYLDLVPRPSGRLRIEVDPSRL